MSAGQNVIVECECEVKFTNGEKGVMKRLRALMPEVKAEFAAHISGSLQLTPQLLRLFGTPSFITEDPANAEEYLKAISVEDVSKHLDTITKLPDDIKVKLLKQLVID